MAKGIPPASGTEPTVLKTPDALLDIPYLRHYWLRSMASGSQPLQEEGYWDLDNTLLSGLGLSLLETARFLQSPPRPSFEEFEQWILEINGGSIDGMQQARLREALTGGQVGSAVDDLDGIFGLTGEELAFWEEHGYVIVHDAVDVTNRDNAAAAIYEFLDADPTKPDTWYGDKYGRSIWVPLMRHPAFLANRKSPRLVKAFAQLWGREDLWAIVDQGGFNPPERKGWNFPGPHLHWDMTLVPPHCFGVQGILYLTDTPAEQGAFSCIPGFHRRLASWLKELPPGEDPRRAIFREAGLTPIAGRAGDLVIWHQALPHGSSPNRGDLPRLVQYITLLPTRWAYTAEWR